MAPSLGSLALGGLVVEVESGWAVRGDRAIDGDGFQCGDGSQYRYVCSVDISLTSCSSSRLQTVIQSL